MIETTTHIAESPGLTLCGLDLPPVNGPRPILPSARVGLTIGRFTYSCYLTGEKDSNAACIVCQAIEVQLNAETQRRGAEVGHGGEIDSGFDSLHGKAGM